MEQIIAKEILNVTEITGEVVVEVTSKELLLVSGAALPGSTPDHAAETATSIAAILNSVSEKTTPVSNDKIPLLDSTASFALKWFSWSRITSLFTAGNTSVETSGFTGWLAGIAANVQAALARIDALIFGPTLVYTWTASGAFATRQTIPQITGLSLANNGVYCLEINAKFVNSSDVGVDAAGVLTFNSDSTAINYASTNHFYGGTHNQTATISNRTFPASVAGGTQVHIELDLEQHPVTGYVLGKGDADGILATGAFYAVDVAFIRKVNDDLNTIDFSLGSNGFAVGSTVKLWKVR